MLPPAGHSSLFWRIVACAYKSLLSAFVCNIFGSVVDVLASVLKRACVCAGVQVTAKRTFAPKKPPAFVRYQSKIFQKVGSCAQKRVG